MRPIAHWVHHELANWARWCWRGPYPHPMPPDHCRSLESNFRAPPEWGEEVVIETKPIPPNADRAKRVQAVYDLLPLITRQVLRIEYPQRWENHEKSVQEKARMIGATVQFYESMLRAGKRAVQAEFERR